MNANKTFFFYDLETSGLNPRSDRIMQFAGQRTDIDLNPIGDSINILVKLTDDILPSPEALLVTGITPQQTITDGISESEFAKLFVNEIAIPGTVILGYNSVRFDDEFIRHTLWRNFYDPYEWSWADGRSRWDMLDVVRLFRSLRPEGINWPVDKEGRATNRLELISKENNLEHSRAHDALSDVEALIGVARLLKLRQPKMFNYLFNIRNKKEIAKLVNLEDPQPFVYASGRYDSKFEKTTVAIPIAPGRKPGSVLVYDLRFNPNDFSRLSESEIKQRLSATYEERKSEEFKQIPVKELQYNRCPAVAPIGVLDENAQKRIKIDILEIQANFDQLCKEQSLIDKISAAWDNIPDYPLAIDVEAKLYDSLIPDSDKPKISAVRNAGVQDLADFNPLFNDERLAELLFRYKARQFPKSLSEDEHASWERFKMEKFQNQLPEYTKKLVQLTSGTSDNHQLFILEELKLWIESIVPIVD